MSIHQQDPDMAGDEEFYGGDISFLVEGTYCRALDGRRTPGYIEKIFKDCGLFRWRIIKFEDKGKYWDLPFEDIRNFQFKHEARRLPDKELMKYKELVERFDWIIHIPAAIEDLEATETELHKEGKDASAWMQKYSEVFRGSPTSLALDAGMLARDLAAYMAYNGLTEVERKTAETMVLNPSSGEWIKGMYMVLGEMGLAPYEGKIARTDDIFQGMGAKERRKDYLLKRLGFIRGAFDLLRIEEVVLYRGMASEKSWKGVPRTLLPCTFSLEVARAFSDFDQKSRFKNSYLLKFTVPVDRLFMTCLETEAMNRQYREAEALILYRESLTI